MVLLTPVVKSPKHLTASKLDRGKSCGTLSEEDVLCLKLRGKHNYFSADPRYLFEHDPKSLNNQCMERQETACYIPCSTASTRLASADVPRSTSIAEDPLSLAFSCGVQGCGFRALDSMGALGGIKGLGA